MLQKPLFAQIFNPLLDLAFMALAILATGNIILPLSTINQLMIGDAIFAFSTILAMFVLRIYSLRNLSFPTALGRIILGIIIGAAVSISAGYLLGLLLPPRVFMAYSLVFVSAGLALSQLFVRLITRLYSLARQPEKIVIFGAGKTAEELLNNLPRGYQVIGLLDNVRKGEIAGIKILDKLKYLDDLLKICQATVVVQTGYFEQTSNLLQLCKKYHAQLYVVPQLLGVFDEKLVDFRFGNSNIFQIKPTPLMGWGAIAKRFCDIVASISLIIILSPLWLAIIILTWMSGVKLPIFITEERVNGANGRKIKLFHFRTLRRGGREPQPTEADYRQFSLDIKKHINNPQATRLGLFLRRTGLAYLPELINVIKGELSIVGPRPPFAAELPAYSHYEFGRFAVKPGMVSLAQMSRKQYGIDEMLVYDRQYVKNWSLWLDAKVLFGVIWRYLAGAR